jgi:hypothetical protein
LYRSDRTENITTTSCGKSEFSYASVCFKWVHNKFKGVFKSQRMWEDARALVSGLEQGGIAEELAQAMKKEVVFSDPRLCHEIQAAYVLHTYRHTYIHTYIHTYKHTHIHIYLFTAFIYIHIYTHMYTYVYIYTYIHIRAHIHIVYIHAHIYIYRHAHIHLDTYTYIMHTVYTYAWSSSDSVCAPKDTAVGQAMRELPPRRRNLATSPTTTTTSKCCVGAWAEHFSLGPHVAHW